jgi:hypothetical protein
MADRRARPGFWTLISLRHSRSLIRRPRFLLLAVVIAIAYGLIAMVVGTMVQFFSPPAHLSSYWVILTTGTPAWNYPALLAVNPYFVLALPFLPTVFMVLTAAGVGLGMTVAVILSANLLRHRRSASARPAAVGTAAGLTPAMIALVTLGACCSTTAAATAGIGITARATGTSTATLLANTWYLGVVQLVILYVALLAQEQLLTVYGSVVSTPLGIDGPAPTPPPLDRRFAAGAVVRIVLLAAGVTWCLAMIADWLTVSPASASTGAWVSWLLQHQLLGFAAIFAALAPLSTYRALLRLASTWSGLTLRLLLVVAGVSLVIGTPPPVAASGWHGFVNELLGVSGFSGAVGGVAPGLSLGLALGLRWAGQYLVLGGFAIALGLRPARALRPILWSVAGGRESFAAAHAPVPVALPVPPVPEGRLALTPETQR